MKINYSKSALKFLVKSEEILYQRIIKKIEGLKENAFPHDCKRIEGKKQKAFRIRVGDYRVIYSVLDEKNIIFISEINKRGKVYE
jgi:mRNA interferase RelE/StbE